MTGQPPRAAPPLIVLCLPPICLALRPLDRLCAIAPLDLLRGSANADLMGQMPEQVFGETPFVLLDDARAEEGVAADALLYTKPREIFVAHSPDEVRAQGSRSSIA